MCAWFSVIGYNTQLVKPEEAPKDRPGRAPLSAIKTMKSDPAAVEQQSEAIKARYAKIFGV